MKPGTAGPAGAAYLRKGETFAELAAGFGVGNATDVRIPYWGRGKPASQKDANRAHAQLRAPGERAHAQLKS